MTKVSRDIPESEGSTIADRLKSARTEAGFTRKALAEATGIPSSTLEKYERGDMDPNTSRLKTICEQLNVTVDWVLNGTEQTEVTELSETAETQTSEDVSEIFSEPVTETEIQHVTETEQDQDIAVLDQVSDLLRDLDSMRSTAFKGCQRNALAMVDDIQGMMKYLEPNELMSLAHDRGLHQDESGDQVTIIIDMFNDDLDEAQEYCGNVEERILDTAILGVDLFNLDRDALVDLADRFNEEKRDNDEEEIYKPKWGGISWGEHKDFVPLIRPIVRSMAFSGNPVEFIN